MMEFNEVKPEHFTTLSRDPYPHILIDRYLMQLCGGGTTAPAYHKKVMAAAGWPHHSLIPFTKYPAEASAAYNRVREALRTCDQDPDALITALGGDPSEVN